MNHFRRIVKHYFIRYRLEHSTFQRSNTLALTSFPDHYATCSHSYRVFAMRLDDDGVGESTLVLHVNVAACLVFLGVTLCW